MTETTIVPLYLAFDPAGDDRLIDHPVPVEVTMIDGRLYLRLDVSAEGCEPAGRFYQLRRLFRRFRPSNLSPLYIPTNVRPESPPNVD